MNSELAHKVLNFLNITVKAVMRASEFNQIGKLPKYFRAADCVPIHQHDLEMWPGYLTQTRLCADGIFLNVDTAARFIQKQTVLDFIRQMVGAGRSKDQISKIFDSSNQDTARKTIITTYNTKSYQVDGLDWTQSPRTHVFDAPHKKDKTKVVRMSMIDYLKEHYGVTLADPNQPLLFVNFRDTRFYFPPECCRDASLPENFTSDSRKMKDLQDFKISDPTKRMDRICALISKIMNSGEF
jgi:aubergine-like protein